MENVTELRGASGAQQTNKRRETSAEGGGNCNLKRKSDFQMRCSVQFECGLRGVNLGMNKDNRAEKNGKKDPTQNPPCTKIWGHLTQNCVTPCAALFAGKSEKKSKL